MLFGLLSRFVPRKVIVITTGLAKKELSANLLAFGGKIRKVSLFSYVHKFVDTSSFGLNL